MPGSAEWPMAKPDSTVVKGQSVFCYSTKKKKKITLEDVVVMRKFFDHTLQMEQKEITRENRGGV